MSEPRVYLSMTTIPSRNGTLIHTLSSLAAQTKRADEIFVYGAHGVDFGDRLWASDELDDVYCTLKTPITFRRIEDDRGPVMKLSILEERTVQDDDIVITIDDDVIYEPRWLETLIDGAKSHPELVVGFCGWNAYDFLRARQENDPSGGSYVWAPIPGPCDVLEGWAGIAYRKRFFYMDPIFGKASVLDPTPGFEFVDDVWIAWHLHRRAIGRAVIGNRMSRERPGALHGLHHREDFVDLNRQAALIAFGGPSR